MYHMLCFSRNRSTSVRRLNDGVLQSECVLRDTLTRSRVEIEVTLPDLTIAAVVADGKGRGIPNAPAAAKRLESIIGTRIGPGVFKIIKSRIGDMAGIGQWIFMVEECCHAVILYFTKDDLAKAPREKAASRKYYTNRVRNNPHLADRCAAFGPGSAFVKEPEGAGN